jgi:hypothetical protein
VGLSEQSDGSWFRRIGLAGVLDKDRLRLLNKYNKNCMYLFHVEARVIPHFEKKIGCD